MTWWLDEAVCKQVTGLWPSHLCSASSHITHTDSTKHTPAGEKKQLLFGVRQYIPVTSFTASRLLLSLCFLLWCTVLGSLPPSILPPTAWQEQSGSHLCWRTGGGVHTLKYVCLCGMFSCVSVYGRTHTCAGISECFIRPLNQTPGPHIQ